MHFDTVVGVVRYLAMALPGLRQLLSNRKRVLSFATIALAIIGFLALFIRVGWFQQRTFTALVRAFLTP